MNTPSRHAQRISHALAWNATGLVVNRGIGLLSKLLMARLLVPDDFGIFAIAIIFVSLLGLCTRLGLPAALIRRPHDATSRRLYDSTFVITGLAGVLLTLVCAVAIAPLASVIYERRDLQPLLMVLSLVVLADATAVVPRLLLTRHQRFATMIRREAVVTVIAAGSAITLAALGFGPWSLLAQALIAAGLTSMLLWQATGFRPHWRLCWAELWALRAQCRNLMANDLLYFLRKQGDYILVGLMLGAPALGIYTLAFTLSETLRMQVFGVINKALFPTYSRQQADYNVLRHQYLSVSHGTALVVWPAAVLLMLYAEGIVSIFGAAWAEAAAPLRILALASLIFTISGTPAEILKAIGKPWISFRVSLSCTLLVALPALMVGISLAGIEGAAWAVVIHYAVSRLVFHLVMRHMLGVTLADLLRAFALPAMGAMVMVAVCSGVHTLAWHWALGALLGGLVYAALTLMVRRAYGR